MSDAHSAQSPAIGLQSAFAAGPAVVFCGAGVSMGPPTCAPNWDALTEELIHAVFQAAPVKLPELEFTDPDRRPEETLESFAAVLGDKFPEVFAVLDETGFNPAQRALARLAKAGVVRAIITTNFDLHFEHALAAEGVEFTRCATDAEFRDWHARGRNGMALLKLHGSVDCPESIVAVASQYSAGGAFSEPKAATFAQYLAESPLIFLGYSGGDFEHPTYQNFWAKAGQRARKIVWNHSPISSADPAEREAKRQRHGAMKTFLRGVLASAGDRLEFVAGYLPDALVESCRALGVPVDGLDAPPIPQNQAQAAARAVRESFWAEWANSVPPPHRIGICLSDAGRFSRKQRRQIERAKKYTATAPVIDIESVQRAATDFQQNMQALTEAFSAGHLDATAFQQQMQALSAEYQRHAEKLQQQAQDLQFKYAGFDENPEARQKIEQRAAQFGPGMREQFISFAVQSMNYCENIDEAMAAADRIMHTLASLQAAMGAGGREGELARLRMQAIGVEMMLAGTPASEAAAVRAKVEALVADVVDGRLSEAEFTKTIGTMTMRQSYRASGAIDATALFSALARTAAEWPDAHEGADAVAMTLISAAANLYPLLADLPQYERITGAASQGGAVSPADLDAIFTALNSPFDALRERLRGLPEAEGALAAIDGGVLAVLTYLFQYAGIDWAAVTRENQALNAAGAVRSIQDHAMISMYGDGSTWPRQKYVPGLMDWLAKRFAAIWPRTAAMPVRYRLPFLSLVARFSEMAGDLKLCEAAVHAALALTDGKVTGALREPIPEALGGFYDRLGDRVRAVNYYELALSDSAPRLMQDLLVYRAFRLHLELDNPHAALRIALTESPQFGHKAMFELGHHRRRLVAELEPLLRQMGFATADAARDALGLG